MMLKQGVLLLNLWCFTMTTRAFKNFTYETKTTLCGEAVLSKRPKTHTIVLNFLQDNWSLNNCLSTLTVNDDRLIFTSDFQSDIKINKKLTYFTYKTPNIVVYARSLSNVIFTNAIASVIFQSHWSIVNIVIVNNATYACQDGYFGREVNSSIYKFLNDFWKEYQVVYVVIEYPDDCPDKFSLYDGNKLSNEVDTIYERTFKTVAANDVHETLKGSAKHLSHGYPLKANIFYRFPTAVNDCKGWNSFIIYNSNLTNGYCGLDALIMHDIIQILKFNASFEMTNITYYGYVSSGNISGSLGLIVRREIDISFNSRFMVSYSNGTELDFLFLHYMWTDSLCAFMKEPIAVPLWHYPFNMYGITMWLLLITILIFVGSIMYVTSRLNRDGEIKLKLYVYALNAVWAGLLGYFFNRRIKRSLLASTLLLCSVVFTAKYQGHVNYMFTTLVRYDRLQTLQQMCDNGVQLYTYPSVAALLGRGSVPKDVTTPKGTLVSNLKLYKENDSATGRTLYAVYALKYPNAATVDRLDILLQNLYKLKDEDGRPLLYAANECFEQYYLSYIVRSGFLFTNHLQVLIMKIVEAGLPAAYYKWTRYTYAVIDPSIKPSSEPRHTVQITVFELRVAFALLFLGYAVSIAVFTVELWLDVRKNRVENRDW